MMMAVLSPKQKFITSEFDRLHSVDYYYLSMKHNDNKFVLQIDPWAHGRAYFGKGQGDIYLY